MSNDDLVLPFAKCERIHEQIESIRGALGTLYAVMDALEAVGLDKAANRLGLVDAALVNACNDVQATLRDAVYLRDLLKLQQANEQTEQRQ